MHRAARQHTEVNRSSDDREGQTCIKLTGCMWLQKLKSKLSNTVRTRLMSGVFSCTGDTTVEELPGDHSFWVVLSTGQSGWLVPVRCCLCSDGLWEVFVLF